MRIFTRVIVAGALVVPMGLGVSGIAVADVATGSSMPAQIGVSEGGGSDDCDHGSDDCDDRSDDCDDEGGGGGFLGGLGLLGGNDSDDDECEKDGR